MPMPQYEHITYEDFSGGFSDNLLLGERNIFEKYENFLITNEKKPYSREGSALIGGSNFLTAVQAYAPTGDLINYQKDTNLLIRSKDRLFVNIGASFSTGTWANLTGPDGNSAFPGLGNFSSVTWDEFNNHTYFVGWDSFNSVYSSPMKVFQDTSGAYTLRNAGLPKFPNNLDLTTLTSILNAAVSLVNDLRTQMQHHFNNDGGVDHGAVHSVSWGSAITVYTTDWPNGFAGTVQRIYSLYTILRSNYEAHIEDARKSYPPTFATYHTQSIYAVGNYYLKPFVDPWNPIDYATTLLDIAPLLNELRRSWYFHVRSFSTADETHMAANFHAGTVYSPTVAAIQISPNPTFSGALTYSSWYTWLNNLIHAFNLHTVSTAYHNVTSPTLPENDAVDIETFVTNFYRVAWYYNDHRVNNTAHGTATADSASTQTYTPGGFDIQNYCKSIEEIPAYGTGAARIGAANTEEALYCLNPDLLAADANYICQKLFYIQILMNKHTYDTSRHFGVRSDVTPLNTILPLEVTPSMTALPSTSLTYASENRAYAFHYRNIYKNLQGFEHEDIGTPYQMSYSRWYPGLTNTLITHSLVAAQVSFNSGGTADLLAIGQPSGSNVKTSVTISNLPALPTTENWPTDKAVIDIYRGATASSVLRKTGTVLHNSVTYTDKTDDSVLSAGEREAIYTTGNNIPYDPPPQSRCFAIINGYGYFGGTVETALGDTQIFPKRLRQSLAGQMDACPGTFFQDLESDIQTIGAARGFPIIVCSRGVYRIDGVYDSLGRGGLNPQRISDTVGGVGPNAGATLNDRFYWAGDTGVYVTDGFEVVKLTKHLDASYLALLTAGQTAKMKLKATVDRKNQRILWTATDTSGFAQTVWVLDVRHSTAERGSFQRLSNGTSYAPTAIAIFKDTLYRGDEDGFVFAHSAGLTNDPKIDRTSKTLTGSTLAIPYQLRTAPDQLGYTHVRKWVPDLEAEFENLGNLSLQIGSVNDKNSGNLKLLNPVRYRGEYNGYIRENRKFPGGGLRCKFKQIDLQPANVILENSDTALTKCHISGTSVSLDTVEYDGSTSSTAQFPTDCVDQFLCIEDDKYVAQYQILAQPSSTTLTLASAPPTSALSRKWIIRGVPKNERVQVSQLTVWYFPMTQTENASTGVDGQNQ